MKQASATAILALAAASLATPALAGAFFFSTGDPGRQDRDRIAPRQRRQDRDRIGRRFRPDQRHPDHQRHLHRPVDRRRHGRRYRPGPGRNLSGVSKGFRYGSHAQRDHPDQLALRCRVRRPRHGRCQPQLHRQCPGGELHRRQLGPERDQQIAGPTHRRRGRGDGAGGKVRRELRHAVPAAGRPLLLCAAGGGRRAGRRVHVAVGAEADHRRHRTLFRRICNRGSATRIWPPTGRGSAPTSSAAAPPRPSTPPSR